MLPRLLLPLTLVIGCADAPQDLDDVDLQEVDMTTPEDALLRFADCMRFDDWVASGMDLFHDGQTAGDDCVVCHDATTFDGEIAPVFSSDSLAFYDQHRQPWGVTLLAAPALDGSGAVVELLPSTVYRDLAQTHPGGYQPDPAIAPSVVSFFDLTYQRLLDQDGMCVRE